MNSDKKLYLERHLQPRILQPIELEGDQDFKYRGIIVRKQSFESRQDSTFGIECYEDVQSISLSGTLISEIKDNITKIITTQKAITSLGIPKEQFEIQEATGQNLFVYNYWRPLNLFQRQSIVHWFGIICAITQDKFNFINNIFILPSKNKKTFTGEPMGGEHKKGLNGFIIYPASFAPKRYRICPIPYLYGILTHEYFHQYNLYPGTTQITREWMNIAGWRLNFNYPKLILKKSHFNIQEDLIESPYGYAAPEEFCEVGVKTIFDRDGFKDKAKRSFIDDNFLVPQSLPLLCIPKIIVINNTIQAPNLPKEFTFTISSVISGS